MRKTIITMLAFLAPFAAEAQEPEAVDSAVAAEFSFHYQSFFEKGSATPRVFGQGYEYFRTEVACGHWGWGYVEHQYVSGVWGLFCDPLPWLSLGAGFGGENFIGESGESQNFGRWALTAFIGTERTFLEYYYENGPSKSPWERVDLQLWSNRYIALGGISQTGDGYGPKLELRLPLKGSWDLRVWGAPMRSKSGVNSLFEAKLVWTLKEPE